MRQVLRAGALGRPRGMGWGGRWERGSGWGTHVNPCLIHVSVWQKTLQYCKLISLQLIKINKKEKKAGELKQGQGLGCHILYFLKVIVFQLYMNNNNSLNSVLSYCVTSRKNVFLPVFTVFGFRISRRLQT